MPRFRSLDQVSTIKPVHQNQPFTNLYGCAEGDFVYINMEAVPNLQKGMRTQRDMYILIDLSGSMEDYYRSGGLFSKKPSKIEQMLTTIVEQVAPFDDDGVDVLFFSSHLVHRDNISSADDVAKVVKTAMTKTGAFYSTMPIDSFEAIADQMRSKGRPATVFFLTDGAMDDDGKALKRFYQEVLHKEFRTRDQFYCYAIEFGRDAEDALEVLNGLYYPEQGPEDLFDVESASNLEEIANVLKQVGGMSAIGSDDHVTLTVSDGAKIDMVNTDLFDDPQPSITGPINQFMSVRVRANGPFTLTVHMDGYDDMKLSCDVNGLDVGIKVA